MQRERRRSSGRRTCRRRPRDLLPPSTEASSTRSAAESQVGPFGAGWVWTNGFGLTLATLPDGDVTITGDGGSETFEVHYGNYISTADDGSILRRNCRRRPSP